MHFWDGKVRLNSRNDLVWSPEKQIRIFKRSGRFKYISTDKNGLHNSLSYQGIKIPLGYSRGKFHALLAKSIRVILNVKVLDYSSPARIYHYHYFSLEQKKINDLRSAEFNWPLKIIEGDESRETEGVVYISNSSSGDEAAYITSRYYYNEEREL
jgi:hypothetical protein